MNTSTNMIMELMSKIKEIKMDQNSYQQELKELIKEMLLVEVKNLAIIERN